MRFQLRSKLVGETTHCAIDFTPLLPAATLLTGTPTVTISTYIGVDANPQAMLSGVPIESGGTQVTFLLTGGVAGVVYEVNVTCSDTNGGVLGGRGLVNVLPATP